MPVLEDRLCPCCAVPEITGDTVELGATACGGAAATTAVAADETFPEPAEFVAVTIVRSVDPTSAAANRYDDPAAPDTEAQLLPAESHRHHWVV